MRQASGGWGFGPDTWGDRLLDVLFEVLTGLYTIFSVTWRGSLGLWFSGIGLWWMGAAPVTLLYAIASGLQLCFGYGANITPNDWDHWVRAADAVPWPVAALPGEVLLSGGLALILSAVRRCFGW